MILSQHALEMAHVLKQGGIIAYPTESVYGLGCDPWNKTAVEQLLILKQRPEHKGLILVISDFSQVSDWLLPVEPEVMKRIFQSWPGPVTWVFPCLESVPTFLRGQHQSLAIRLSAHPVVQALCRAYGPIVSTSANRSDEPSITTWEAIEHAFPTIDALWKGDVGGLLQPSTIIDVKTGCILRQGEWGLNHQE